MSACVTEEIKHAKELNVNVSNGKKRPVEVERETLFRLFAITLDQVPFDPFDEHTVDFCLLFLHALPSLVIYL